MSLPHESDPNLVTDTGALVAEHSAEDSAPRTRWLSIVALALGTLVVASEMTMSAFALPKISLDLGIGSSTTAWVLTAYTLPLVAAGVPAGRWMDNADSGLVFLIALVAAALAGVLSALAPNFEVLLFSRILQGLAAAFFLGIYMPIISQTVRVDQRGAAIGVIGTIMMVGSIGLAPLGGLVAETWGWRAVFLIKVPLIAVTLLLGFYTIPRLPPVTVSGKRRLPMLDRTFFRESAWLGAAMAALLLGLAALEGEPVKGITLLAVSLTLLVRWSRLASARSVVELLRRPRFGLPSLALTLVASTIGLASFTLPFYISEVMNRTAEVLAWAMIGFVGASAVCSPIAGLLADRFGALFMSMVGAALTVAGLLTLTTQGETSGVAALIGCATAAGAGLAVFNTPIMTAMLAAAPKQQSGTASGLAGVTRMLGSTIGPAVAALAWSLAGGGVAGLHAGVYALAALTFAGFVALAVALRSPV